MEEIAERVALAEMNALLARRGYGLVTIEEARLVGNWDERMVAARAAIKVMRGVGS